jgi:hypothetical protein
MPVHALLHIADDIRQVGPVWCYWAFAMERYCGLLATSRKSRRDPFVSLSRRIRDIVQLNQIKVKYNLADQLNLGVDVVTPGKSYIQCELLRGLFNNVVHIPRTDPDVAMMRPYRVSRIDDAIRRKIAAHLVTNIQNQQHVTVNTMLPFIPIEIPHWGKMKILSCNETIRTIAAVGSGERGMRDNTFIKVEKPFPILFSLCY